MIFFIGVVKEFTLSVGETVDFVCIDPNNVKHFKTEDPELLVIGDIANNLYMLYFFTCLFCLG